MALLDSILGGLLGGGQQSSPIGSILGSLLGGGGGGGSAIGAAGGVGGLIGRMEQAGLGQVAQSWVGNGPNQAVSPSDLQKVFHPDELNQMSQQAGVPQGDLLSQLAQFLPHAVDQMTPGGQVPQGGATGGVAGGAAGGGGGDPFSTEATGNPRI